MVPSIGRWTINGHWLVSCALFHKGPAHRSSIARVVRMPRFRYLNCILALSQESLDCTYAAPASNLHLVDVSEQADVIAAASSTLAIQLQSTGISTPNCCGPDPFLCHPARLGTQHSLPRLSIFNEAALFLSSWISALPSEGRTLFSTIAPAQKPTNPVVSHLLLWTSLV